MDRVWLREYEKMLSSNRRSLDNRPMSADISNNRVKKGRPVLAKKKKKDAIASELDVARELLVVATDIDEYDPHFVERQEKQVFRRKLENNKSKNPTNKLQVSFKKLSTFDEFRDTEGRRQLCFATGDRDMFRSLYPDIELHKSPKKKEAPSDIQQRPKSSPLARSRSVPFQLTFVAEEELVSRPERPPAQFELEVAQQALALWRAALTALRLRGKNILYEDLSKFSKGWKRSPRLRDMVVYVSILLGLKSDDPKITQRSVFRELYSLLKFFREVNPLTLPRRRVVKANSHYESYIAQRKQDVKIEATGDEDAFELNISGWIEAMQTILAIMLDAKQRHEVMNANYDEKLSTIEAEFDKTHPPTSTTPDQHELQRQRQRQRQSSGGRSAGRETARQEQHRMAKNSPTGTWSTRLTSPAQLAAQVEREQSMGEAGLHLFDSTSVMSLLDKDFSPSALAPLDDLSLEYSPDRSEAGAGAGTAFSPAAHNHYLLHHLQKKKKNNEDSDAEDLLFRHYYLNCGSPPPPSS